MTRQPGLYATFETSEGTIVCRLFEKDAPKTVANFVELAEGKREWTHPSTRKKSKDRLYDGTIFHRVIPDFMIQGGDPQGTGMGGPGYQFEDETKGSPHKFDKPGKLAMANAGPNTNGSQFFITMVPTTWLTGKHTIFGEVVEGQDVAEKIVAIPRNRQDRPNKDVVLKKVTDREGVDSAIRQYMNSWAGVSGASSAVTSVSSNTFAVAARKWSAGSPCERFIDEMASATSTVRGASMSCKSSMVLATHARTSCGSSRHPLRCSTISSPTLTGDSHNSFAESASALSTRRVRRCGSSVLQSQM